MFKRGMDSKGQLSVEYLFLLMIILVVFGFMITNFIAPSIDASNDISDVSGASNAVNSIANAANVVYANGPGSKRTLNVYIPQNNMKIQRGNKLISTNVTLSDGSTKLVTATTGYTLSSSAGTNLPKGWRKVTIQWDPGTTSVTIAV